MPPLLTEDPARKKPPLEPDNPFADLVPQAVEPDNPFADLVKAAKPSTYGLEPAPPSAMPVRRKPGVYKSPIPPAVVAPADVTDITPKAEHTLGHHMPGAGESLPGALVESAMEMVTKPHILAKELIMTAPRAGAAWSDYLKGTGTAKEAALKTLQTIALGAAGPAEKAVAERLVSTLGPKLAEAAATTAVGAGAGATFTPDRPALGAILGAAGGVARLPAAVADLGDVSAGAVEAGTQALKAAPPPPVHTPIDQPQPLSRPQEVLRARLATEGVVPGDEADTAFGDFEDLVPEKTGEKGPAPTESVAEKEPSVSDVLNVAKLNLGDRTAEQRMAAKLEEFRAQREANKQTFAEADVNRADILNELRAGDPLALPTEKAKKLSGEQLLARRDLVRENDQTIAALSKKMEAGMPPEAYSQAAQLVQRAVDHNDALLSDLVTGSSQKGRDLNLLRRMANNSLDPAVWRVQAKRMLGDRPLTAEIDAAIRKLAAEAEAACQ